MKSGKVYAIIPARAGSKGVPKKNIRPLKGYPLIAYSIAAARLSKNINRIIVSTNSPEIAETAKTFGAEVPFLRPDAYARDMSPDIEFIRHAIDWFGEHENEQPDLFVHLRPTTPLREPGIISKAIELIWGNSEATALRSVHELAEPPQKMVAIDSLGFITGLFPQDLRPEYYNLPRQVFPKAYHPNGYVDIIRPEYVKSHSLLHGPRVLGFVTPFTIEIDRPEDFDYLEYTVNRKVPEIFRYLIQNY